MGKLFEVARMSQEVITLVEQASVVTAAMKAEEAFVAAKAEVSAAKKSLTIIVRQARKAAVRLVMSRHGVYSEAGLTSTEWKEIRAEYALMASSIKVMGKTMAQWKEESSQAAVKVRSLRSSLRVIRVRAARKFAQMRARIQNQVKLVSGKFNVVETVKRLYGKTRRSGIDRLVRLVKAKGRVLSLIVASFKLNKGVN